MTLEQRLERLERQNRWMRRIGAVGIAAIAVVMLVGQGAAPDAVRARAFIVVDSQGAERAILGSEDKHGIHAHLVMLDSDDNRRLVLRVQENSPWGGFTDEKGVTRLALSDRGIEVSDAAVALFHEVAAAAPGLPREEALTAKLEYNGLAFFGSGLAPVVTLSDDNDNVIWKAPGE